MNDSMQPVVPVMRHVLAGGLRVRARVTGTSMRPFVCDGELMEFVAQGAEMPRPGQILLVRTADGALVLHRVSRTDGSRFYMRGDAQAFEEGPLVPEQVIARGTGIVRNGRLVPLDIGILRLTGHLWRIALPVRLSLIVPLRTARRLLSRMGQLLRSD